MAYNSLRSYKTEYSENEKRMFNDILTFSSEYPIETFDCIPLYKMAVECAFVDDRQGESAQNLRKAYKHIFLDGKYRMTQEFEDLFSWDEN